MSGFYKKLCLVVAVLLLLPSFAFSDRIGLLNSEGDGAPADEYAYKVVWPNGTIAIVNGVLTYTPVAGSGDVTSVGDCASGACGDGTSDGGTYYRLYDGTANYLQLAVSGALGGDLTLNLDTLLSTGSPSFAAVTATGASGVTAGVASTTLGLISLYNNATANAFSIFPGATGVGVGWRLPIAAPGGANYLLNVDAADGTMDYTDPATFLSNVVEDTTPQLGGPLDMNGQKTTDATGIDDDDCTGDQGKFWWDSTDLQWEFCVDNSGTPITLETIVTLALGVDNDTQAELNAKFDSKQDKPAEGAFQDGDKTALDNLVSNVGKIWGATSLTGGGAGALDAFAIAGLTDNDLAIVRNGTQIVYMYLFDADSTDAEASPTRIRPDDYATQGVWELFAYWSDGTFLLSSIQIPNTSSGDQTITSAQIGIKLDEDLIVTHGGAAGEVQDEAGISLINTLTVRFDPEYEYDTITNKTIDLLEIGDESPHGITITEWRIEYLNGDPTTEIDLDLMCDTTPDWNPAAGGTVMDVLDTTTGTATADTGFDSATCANGAYLYLRFGADPVDSGEIVRFKLSYFKNED